MMKMRKKVTVIPIPSKLPTLATTAPTASPIPESFESRPISDKSSVKVPFVEFNDSVIDEPMIGEFFT